MRGVGLGSGHSIVIKKAGSGVRGALVGGRSFFKRRAPPKLLTKLLALAGRNSPRRTRVRYRSLRQSPGGDIYAYRGPSFAQILIARAPAQKRKRHVLYRHLVLEHPPRASLRQTALGTSRTHVRRGNTVPSWYCQQLVLSTVGTRVHTRVVWSCCRYGWNGGLAARSPGQRNRRVTGPHSPPRP